MKESLKDITKKYVKSTMAEPFKEAIKTNVDSILLANSASEDVKNEAKKVTERGGNLLRELGEVLPEIEAFLNTCNDVVTGVGSRGEYLLDLCAQQGQYCIEKTFSQHAGCCCGYNPISSLGMGSTIITKATIKGTRANPAWEPRSAEHRRLQEDSIAYNICGEASKATKESISVYETKLKKTFQMEKLFWLRPNNISKRNTQLMVKDAKSTCHQNHQNHHQEDQTGQQQQQADQQGRQQQPGQEEDEQRPVSATKVFPAMPYLLP